MRFLCVAQAGLKLTEILLLHLPEGWGYKIQSPCPVSNQCLLRAHRRLGPGLQGKQKSLWTQSDVSPGLCKLHMVVCGPETSTRVPPDTETRRTWVNSWASKPMLVLTTGTVQPTKPPFEGQSSLWPPGVSSLPPTRTFNGEPFPLGSLRSVLPAVCSA